jgi:hypothetical protein
MAKIIVDITELPEEDVKGYKYLMNEFFRIFKHQFLTGSMAGEFDLTDIIKVKWRIE